MNINFDPIVFKKLCAEDHRLAVLRKRGNDLDKLRDKRRAELRQVALMIALREATREMKRHQPNYHAHHDKPKEPKSNAEAQSGGD